jgi:hypothetical protein
MSVVGVREAKHMASPSIKLESRHMSFRRKTKLKQIKRLHMIYHFKENAKPFDHHIIFTVPNNLNEIHSGQTASPDPSI